MANLTVYKNTNATLAGTGWTSNVVPDSQDIAFIGAEAANLTSITPYGTASPNASALKLATEYTSSGNRLDIDDPTNATAIYRLYNQSSSTQKVDGVYSLYIAAGRTLGLGQRLQLRGPNAAQATNRWFIGSGGALILNPSNNTARFGDVYQGDFNGATLGFAMRVIKEGEGYAYVARSTSAVNTSSFLSGGYTIRNGEIRLDGFSSANPLGAAVAGVANSNTLIFDPDSGSAQPTLRFVVNQSEARTVANPVTVNTRGRVIVEGAFVATMTGAASGSGTLTIARTGSGGVTWNNNISCPLEVTGLLTMGTNTISSSTVTGSGSIAGNYNRSVVGSCTDSCNSTGYPQILSSGATGTLTISGAWSGSLAVLYSTPANPKNVILTGSFAGIPTDVGFGNTIAIGDTAEFRLSGATASIAAPIRLYESAKLGLAQNAVMTRDVACFQSTDHFISADASQTAFSGNLTSAVTTNTTFIDVEANGTLSLTGAAQTFSTGAAARRIKKRQAGRVKVTGRLTVNTAPFDVAAGTLEISSTSQAAFNAGLSMAANTTLACSSTGPYAAQLSGNVTLATGSIMQFGIAA